MSGFNCFILTLFFLWCSSCIGDFHVSWLLPVLSHSLSLASVDWLVSAVPCSSSSPQLFESLCCLYVPAVFGPFGSVCMCRTDGFDPCLPHSWTSLRLHTGPTRLVVAFRGKQTTTKTRWCELWWLSSIVAAVLSGVNVKHTAVPRSPPPQLSGLESLVHWCWTPIWSGLYLHPHVASVLIILLHSTPPVYGLHGGGGGGGF